MWCVLKIAVVNIMKTVCQATSSIINVVLTVHVSMLVTSQKQRVLTHSGVSSFITSDIITGGCSGPQVSPVLMYD